MVEYFYTEDYGHHPPFPEPQSWETEIHLHIDVYILAEKYNIQQLRDISAAKIRSIARTKRAGLPGIIREVYENTTAGGDQGIRDILTEIAAAHARWLFMAVGEEFRMVLLEVPVFGRDLAEFLCGARRRVEFEVGS